MKKVINIQEAKTHLSRLVEDAVAGEEIVVGKAGKPMVRLVPYREPRAARKGGQFGGGRIVESEDCWQPDEDPFDGSLDVPLLYRSVDQPSSRVADDSPNAGA